MPKTNFFVRNCHISHLKLFGYSGSIGARDLWVEIRPSRFSRIGIMKNLRVNFLVAATVGAAMTVATPASAFHGGGFGGMHGGGFGGMHGGGGTHLGGGAPGRMAFGSGAFHHPAQFHNFGFRNHHRVNNFVFFGAPYFDAGYGDTCWRRVWTGYNWRWSDLCSDYGY
jgi:hypothetical protein